MKKDKEIEQMLLDDKNYEKFLKAKTEKEFTEILNTKSLQKENIITDIKKVPTEKLFSKSSTYTIISKVSKTKSYINGLQAESYLVSLPDRQKLLSKETDYFVYKDYYIKFYEFKA